MVARDLTKRRIAPLQWHSEPMWTYTGRGDAMRLSKDGFTPEVLGQIMGVLFVKPKIPTLDGEDAQPLLCFAEESITEQRQVMPIFDEWGIVPKGHRGPRPNPWVVEPETMGEGPEPEETEESEGSSRSEAPSGEDDASRGTVPGGEDEASRGTGPGGEDEARSGANPSRGSATTSRSAPVEVDLEVLSSSDEEDNFQIGRAHV